MNDSGDWTEKSLAYSFSLVDSYFRTPADEFNDDLIKP